MTPGLTTKLDGERDGNPNSTSPTTSTTKTSSTVLDPTDVLNTSPIYSPNHPWIGWFILDRNGDAIPIEPSKGFAIHQQRYPGLTPHGVPPREDALVMPPNTSIPKIFMAGGIVGFGYYMVMRPYWFPNPYKTRETQNIEDRFTAGGGTPNGTPGMATKRGDSKNTENRMATPMKSPDTEHFKERYNDQKHPSQPVVMPGKFYEQQLGNEKGK